MVGAARKYVPSTVSGRLPRAVGAPRFQPSTEVRKRTTHRYAAGVAELECSRRGGHAARLLTRSCRGVPGQPVRRVRSHGAPVRGGADAGQRLARPDRGFGRGAGIPGDRPARTSVNPVLAALVGAAVLGQHFDALAWLAIAVIVGADTAAVSTAPGQRRYGTQV